MARLYTMPLVAANAVEAVLSEWAVAEGDTFAAQDVLATVETEKAVVDIDVDEAGVLLRTLASAGATVDVGAPIAVLTDPGETVPDLDALLAELGVASASAAAPVPVPATPTPGETNGKQPAHTSARIFASPLARRLAKESSLDLHLLSGTGPRGRIRRVDVETALAARPDPAREMPAPAPTTLVGASAVQVPHSRMRRAIARRLAESQQTVPHFYVNGTARVERLEELRGALREAGASVSLNVLVLKAAAAALKAVPEMNVTWGDEAVRQYSAADIAVAVATDSGLVTPIVHGVDTLSVTDVAERVRDLANRARTGQLRQDELEGGSFTVSNLGMYGTEEFAGVVNPPHAGLLAVGAVRTEPVVARDGSLEAGRTLKVVLSADHRPVDGVVAARWMAAFLALLENPLRIVV